MVSIVQFGEGNFLRAFVDWMMQPDSIIVVKPRPGSGLEKLRDLDFRYCVALRGLQDGVTIDAQQRVESIAGAIHPYEQYQEFMQSATEPQLRFVVSNTTEAGIQFDPTCRFTDEPALSFPGKLTQFLYHRWKYFQGDPSKGLVILPCELIFHNGHELTRCIEQYIELWALDPAFLAWFRASCPVYNTLVDRIVPGGPDPAMVQAEPYHLWVIEGPQTLRQELPLREGDFNILFTDDEEPYHQLKVKLLNGPHTALSAVGHLCGLSTVRESLLHPVVGRYIHHVMMDELLPTVALSQHEAEEYAQTVLDRFLNPYVKHQLTSILLNNLSKYRTRNLPALLWHVEQKGQLPSCLCLSLAANLICAEIADPRACLSDAELWGQDLTQIDGLQSTVEHLIEEIKVNGMLQTLEKAL